MCPPGYHHNGFMATPELGHRMLNIYIYIFWLIFCNYEFSISTRGRISQNKALTVRETFSPYFLDINSVMVTKVFNRPMMYLKRFSKNFYLL